MEEGSLRCDANVSICPVDAAQFGTRAELKNINSFRFVRAGLDYEVGRQIDLVESGERVVQETRLWNSAEGRTVSMRSKEEAHDYRYFPEPDLPLLTLDAEWVRGIRSKQTELPQARAVRFVEVFELSEYDASILTSTRALADYFEAATEASGDAKSVANWMMGDLLRLLKDDHLDAMDLSGLKIRPRMLASMIGLIDSGTISGKIAKTVMEEMYRTGKSADDVVQERGLEQISDTGEIERIVDEIVDQNPGPADQYRSGKTGTLGWFVGQVMKATKGRANPKSVNDLLRKRLAG